MSETTGLPSVEEVAEVLWDLDRKRYDYVFAWPQVNDPTVELYDLGDDCREEARAVLALFEAAVPRIKAEALREAAADINEFGQGAPTDDWLRDRADMIESEAGKQ